MDDKIVIDCIGPSVLTITISGATYSVPLATNVIRIGGPGGGAEHDLDTLPLIYDAAALGGRLNICDGGGKMVYCWRSLVRLQSRSSAPVQGPADHSSSSPLGPVPRTEMNTSDSNSAAASSSELGDHCSNSKRTGDTSRMSTDAHTATLKTCGNLNHDMTDSRESSSGDTLEQSPQKPESPPSESLVLRFKRHLEELKRRSDWAKLLECILCRGCWDEPKNPVVFNCFHVACKMCLTRLQYQAAERDHEVTCAECKEVVRETQSCEGLEELRGNNLRDVKSKVGDQNAEKHGRKTAERYIDLEDEDTAPGFTLAENRFLLNSINKLLKLSYSTNSDDLRAMRRKLNDGLYNSVKALKADLDRMEHSSMMENGPNHGQTEQARSLRVAFETYMNEYPGQGEEFTPRKKVKTTRPKTPPPAKKPARAKASSPPRAAKTAMQGQKYPRDHW